MTLSEIVDWIILAGAFFGAIYKIYDFFAKPTSKIKKIMYKREEVRICTILDKKMPDLFLKHDLETRDKYKKDRERYLEEIKQEVIEELGCDVNTNNKTIEALVISTKDVLREKIMMIYHRNKHNRTLTEYEREALDQYYIDYKALCGNSYIDKRYARMDKWSVIYDDDPYDEEE